MRRFLLSVFCQLLLVEYVLSQSCEFRFGVVSYLSGSLETLGKVITSGYQMAVWDYTKQQIHNMNFFTSNIEKLSDGNGTCSISIDLRDIETNIKVAIVEVFSLSSTYDQCAVDDDTNGDNAQCSINLPFIVGPAASSHCLTTNPLVEAFNLLQFSPSATSTILSGSEYDSFYRPIPSDDVQAKALIDLCAHFEWDEIGVLYINNDYGSSLQQAIIGYANSADIKTTTFSYIDSDNVTLSDAVESMFDSNIFVFILIVYDGDVELLSYLLTDKYSMNEYPYYYVGVDSWLYNSEFSWPEYLNIYGGMIGTCPWSPSMNDSLNDLYPYPLNESLKMYELFYNEFTTLEQPAKTDVVFNVSEPGLFTIYAYDVVLTIIKMIDTYIDKYEISSVNEFWEMIYASNTDTIIHFKEILSELWFIGLSGNVSYNSGDRANGLFSFCNVDPETGAISSIGFSFGDQVIINEDDITWPPHSYSSDNLPKTAYSTKNNGIASESGNGLAIFIWIVIFISMLLVAFYVFLLYFYRERKIIKASQWRLNGFMAFGCIICYLSLILFGIDESFPSLNKLDYNWKVLCNFRMILLNLSFTLIFGPLFTKIWRIKTIFNAAMVSLKRKSIPNKQLLLYNAIALFVDIIICLILSLAIPYDREYRVGEIKNYATTYWGSCTTEYSYVYFIVLGLPKLIFSLYCIIVSISVYSTVSMMKFNEGLQVLICMVISVILIFVTLGILSIVTINSATSAIFFYCFISLILLMICNFCCAVMMLPRIFSIWKGFDDEEYVNNNNEMNAVKKYMKKLKSNLNTLALHKFSSTDATGTGTHNEDTVGTVGTNNNQKYGSSQNLNDHLSLSNNITITTTQNNTNEIEPMNKKTTPDPTTPDANANANTNNANDHDDNNYTQMERILTDVISDKEDSDDDNNDNNDDNNKNTATSQSDEDKP